MESFSILGKFHLIFNLCYNDKVYVSKDKNERTSLLAAGRRNIKGHKPFTVNGSYSMD